MNALTVNLHLLLLSFYRPTSSRYKIIMEAGAFPPDQYAAGNQVKMHGLHPEDAINRNQPTGRRKLIREEDLLSSSTAIGIPSPWYYWPGINYYTGSFLTIPLSRHPATRQEALQDSIWPMSSQYPYATA